MLMKSLFATVLAVVLSSCGASPLVATLAISDAAQLSIELRPSHPFLAEHDRIAVLQQLGHTPVRVQLAPDSGGFSTTNVYRCGPGTLMLTGYFDSWIVDSARGTVTEGKCDSHSYLGVFDGGGSAPWRYYSASERPERLLEPRGG